MHKLQKMEENVLPNITLKKIEEKKTRADDSKKKKGFPSFPF